MKRILFFILPCILVTCTSIVPRQPIETATTNPKLFALTAEAETVTSGYPANDATITAIMANKYAGGTEMAATMTAQPTETPVPTIPPDSPFCHPADLKTSFASNGATGSILLGAGLTNISGTPCYLQAWPQVLLMDQRGKPLDTDYGYFDMGAGDAASAATEQAQESASAKVGLWPGWTVWLNLIWRNWCGAPVSGGVVIHLTLVNNAGTINVPTDVQSGGACNAPGYRPSVGISKLGPAIPPQ
ncbi:MAG TPA: DUF4232 domain-containing protein [Anaerolineales bacterium]